MTIKIKKSHKGLLHKDLGVKPGKKLTEKELLSARNSSDGKERKRAVFAINAAKWNKGK